MSNQASAVLEKPAMSEGVASLVSQEAAAPQPGRVEAEQFNLPTIQPPTAEEIAKAKAAADALVEATKAAGLVRFESNFKLESEVVGVTRKSTSKKGAVTLQLLPTKDKNGPSMQSASAAMNGGVEMTGEALKAFVRLKSDELKTVQVQEAVRLGGDINWTGGRLVLNSKGNKATIEFKKVEPIKVTVTGAPSDEAIAKAMGWTVEQVKAARIANELKAQADKAAKELADKKAAEQAIADQKAEAELAAEELAQHSANNGSATIGTTPAPSDNDTE